MQQTPVNNVTEGVKFVFNHPTVEDDSVHVVKAVKKSGFGLIISYEEGDVHESLCNFLFD